MHCKECGKSIDDDSKFCRFCGKAQLATPAANRPAAAAPDPGNTGTDPAVKWAAWVGGAIFLLIVIIIIAGGSGSPPSGTNANLDAAVAVDANMAMNDPTAVDASILDPGPQPTWSYSTDQDKVRGATSYFARTTSINSIYQASPYDSQTTMEMVVRNSPAYGTDVMLIISSGQMMCPSYEGCEGTVRFDNGPAENISFSGPADNSSDTVFVDGAERFIAKLKKSRRVVIEKTLYEAGNPQFEFNVDGLKWEH